MAVAFAVLQPGAVLGTSAAAVVTSAANTQSVIKRAVCSNVTAGAVTITVHRVPSSGAVSAATIIVPSRSISADGTDLLPELANMVLNAGDTIQALASAATSVNFFASGFTS